MKTKIAYIYLIISPSGKKYVGSTINLKKRKSDYTNKAVKSQIKIYRSIKRYGWGAHNFYVLFVTDQSLMLTFERLFGERYNCLDKNIGLNLRLPKYGEMKSVSDETRTKMALANTGKRHSEETRRKLALAHTRRTYSPCSEETKEKIRKGNLGKFVSEVTKQKISKSHLGKRVDAETKLKISAFNKGKIFSSITKNKISLALKGRKYSEETIKKMSLAKKGKINPITIKNLKFGVKGEKRNPLHVKNMIEARKRLIVDIVTGVYYASITEASNSITHIKRKTLNAMLVGQLTNRSNFIYA